MFRNTSAVRKTWFLALGLLTVGAAACDAPLPTTPESVSGNGGVTVLAQPGTYLKGPDLLGALGLSCVLGNGSVSLTVGDDGGKLTLGGITLEIPKHALSHLTQILMVPIPGNRPAVQFFPEGLVFNSNKDPKLTFDTDCIGNPANSVIVYTNDFGLIKENKGGVHVNGHSVTAEIQHFSRYAVSW